MDVPLSRADVQCKEVRSLQCVPSFLLRQNPSGQGWHWKDSFMAMPCMLRLRDEYGPPFLCL